MAREMRIKRMIKELSENVYLPQNKIRKEKKLLKHALGKIRRHKEKTETNKIIDEEV